MIPGIWLCAPNSVLLVFGVLLHPVGLLLLYGTWGLAEAFWKHKLAQLLWRLLVVLGLMALGLNVLTLVAVILVGHLRANPTPVIEGSQYLGTVASWVAAAFVVKGDLDQSKTVERAPSRGVSPESPTFADVLFTAVELLGLFILQSLLVVLWTGALSWGAATALSSVAAGVLVAPVTFVGGVMALAFFHQRLRVRRRLVSRGVSQRYLHVPPWPLAGSLVSALGIFEIATGPLFSEKSLLAWLAVPFALARGCVWVATPRVSSDECLAERVAIDFTDPLFGSFMDREPPAMPPPHSEDFGFEILPDPRRPAYAELKRRGASAVPGMARLLSRRLERDLRGEVGWGGDSNWLVKQVARKAGAHPVVEAWATSAPDVGSRHLAQIWLVCAKRNRLDLIGQSIDGACTTADDRVDEAARRWEQWRKQ